MKVGLVTRYFPPFVRGGSHLSAFYLAKGLAQKGHEVHILTTTPTTTADQYGDRASWYQSGLTRHEIFRVHRPTTAWEMDRVSFLLGVQLRRYLHRHGLRFDILHAYGMDTIPAVVMARRAGRPVATWNGYWATCPFWDHTSPLTHQLNPVCDYRHLGRCVAQRDAGRSGVRRFAKRHLLFASLQLHRLYAHRLARLLPVSQSVHALLQANGFPRERLSVCYSMVDPTDYASLDPTDLYRRYHIPADRRIVLHAGRFAPYKGSADIIRAAPSIVRQHPEVHFVFVGQGSTLPALKAQAGALGLHGRMTFGDFVHPKDMPHVYASSYVVLHTATWPEPFARNPIEALAAGTAVIGTATGGTPEVITDGETGMLVPAGNPAALATACNTLLSNPAWRHRLARQGQARVYREFSIEGQIGAYLAAYESVV